MLKKLTPSKIALGLIVIGILINLFAYPFLPQTVSVHFDQYGKADGDVSKIGYLLFMALISVAVYVFTKVARKITDFRIVAISILLLGINIVILFVNLK